MEKSVEAVQNQQREHSYMGWKEQCKHFKMNKENIAIWSGKSSVKQREHSYMG